MTQCCRRLGYKCQPVSGVYGSQTAEKLNRKLSTISTTKKNIFVKLEIDNIVQLAHLMNTIEPKKRGKYVVGRSQQLQ